MPITKEELECCSREQIKELLEGPQSAEVLMLLDDERTNRFKNFFLEYMNISLNKNFQDEGLANQIAETLYKNPFDVPDIRLDSLRRRIDRYIKGITILNRYYAYQICIAFELNIEHSKNFFNKYLNLEFTPFNDWRDILYCYCLHKRYDLKQTYNLYKRCIDKKEVGLDESGLSHEIISKEIKRESTTKLTSVIHGAYLTKQFVDDNAFILFMSEQKDNFHSIRGHRREKLKEFLNEIEKKYESKSDDYAIVEKEKKFYNRIITINQFAGAFFDDDEIDYNDQNSKDYNFTYFKKMLSSLKGKIEKFNFSREFFILCWLISGGDNIDELDMILSDEYVNYLDINVTILFDAMIYEACKYHERNKDNAYDRFIELTSQLSYKRKEKFAEENKQ